jgi:hypothetical protein
MTASNRHLGTAARRLLRALLVQAACCLITAILAAPARAQNVIQFSLTSNTATEYKVRDDGTGLQTLSFPPVIVNKVYATAQSSYPGGRQYLYPHQNGLLPNGNPSYDLMAWSEGSGQSRALTNIHGPLYVDLSSARWSNDGLDSFVSLRLFNFATNEQYTYRAHVSATDLASPTFQPLTLGDPRLELVADWGTEAVGYWYWWNQDGSGFYYVDGNTGTDVIFRAVGGGDTLVYSGTVTLSELRVSPASDSHLVATTLPIGTGILAIDLQTSASWWLATGTRNVSGPRGPAFSPDGSLVAFGSYRTAKGKTYPGVYKVPFIGGPLYKVTELQTSGYVTVNNWDTP